MRESSSHLRTTETQVTSIFSTIRTSWKIHGSIPLRCNNSFWTRRKTRSNYCWSNDDAGSLTVSAISWGLCKRMHLECTAGSTYGLADSKYPNWEYDLRPDTCLPTCSPFLSGWDRGSSWSTYVTVSFARIFNRELELHNGKLTRHRVARAGIPAYSRNPYQ